MSSRQLAAMHYGNAVSKRYDFIEVVRYQQHCRSCITRSQQLSMHIANRTYV